MMENHFTKLKTSLILEVRLKISYRYTKRLHLLEKFQSRLLKEAKENNVVPEKVVQEIFSNLSSICTFHATMLLPDLEKRITEWYENKQAIYFTKLNILMIKTRKLSDMFKMKTL